MITWRTSDGSGAHSGEKREAHKDSGRPPTHRDAQHDPGPDWAVARSARSSRICESSGRQAG